MPTVTLDQVQHLIDQLSPLEQVRLLEYLTPRIVKAGPEGAPTAQPVTQDNAVTLTEAWQAFFRIGDALAATDRPELPTLTQTVQTMRR